MKHSSDTPCLKFTPDKKASESLKHMASLGEIKVVRAGSRAAREAFAKDDNSHKNGKGDNKQAVVPAPRPSPRKTSSFKASPRATPRAPSRPKMIASFSGRSNSDTMRTDLRGVVCLRSGDIIVMDVHFRNKRYSDCVEVCLLVA